jgi:hypothetical protein
MAALTAEGFITQDATLGTAVLTVDTEALMVVATTRRLRLSISSARKRARAPAPHKQPQS